MNVSSKTFGQKTIRFLIWLFEWEEFDDPDDAPSAASTETSQAPVQGDTRIESDSAVAITPRPAPVQPVTEELSNGIEYRLEFLQSFTTAKDPGIQESNEDAWAWDADKARAAVFDGATESFAAQRWSGLLSEKWQTGDENWVGSAQGAYAQAMEGVELTWAQEAAAERGSFATFASVRAVTGGVELEIVGDSCVFLIKGNRIVRSAPFTEETQFSSAPQALASAAILSESNEKAVSEAIWRLAIEPGTVEEVLLATDAISAWLLGDNRETRMGQLLAVSDAEAFKQLVHAERETGRLKADDSTVVRLALVRAPQ